MYYPYFRGKQFELLCIKENPELFKDGLVTPIIEPVKRNLAPLIRALSAISDSGGRCLLVVNPIVGEIKSKQSSTEICDLVGSHDFRNSSIVPTFIVSGEVAVEDIKDFLGRFPEPQNPTLAFINLGFPQTEELISLLKGRNHIHVFDHEKCPARYRAKFADISLNRITLRDGFTKRQNNQEYSYAPTEIFSDSNITYRGDGFCGFSDYLNVGRDFMESGGPAYSIAIHLTWANQYDDNAIYISHYVSHSAPKSPGDIALKFYEALKKLIDDAGKFLETNGLKELKGIFQRGDFKGLGYLKKLTMLHHVETVRNILSK